MVFRIFVEKHKEFAHEAASLLNEARNILEIKGLTDVRIFNRYDAENIDAELFDYAVRTVFSEPQVDTTYKSIDVSDAAHLSEGETAYTFSQGVCTLRKLKQG